MKKMFFLFFLLYTAPGLSAQVLSTVGSRWSDSFVEWAIYAIVPPDQVPGADSTEQAELEEDELGELKLRWLDIKDDWSEWDFSLGDDLRGTIKQKWKDDKTQWELRTYDGSIITMRAAWANDLTEWRITDNTTTLLFRSRWTNQYDDWGLKDQKYGQFHLYTLRSRDPREWAIEDSLDATISLPIKMAMVFLAVFHASPKQ